MRIHLKLSPNREIVPYNYQQSLVGAFHRWIGENELHDDTSMYSLSQLSNGRRTKNGFTFPNGCEFFISSPLQSFHQQVIQGVFNGADIRWGMKVEEVTMKMTPDFGSKHRFLAQSPILIKRNIEGQKHQQYYYPKDKISDTYLTETLQYKLAKQGLTTDVHVAFDHTYHNPIIKMVKYRDINIKGTLCPVIVEGDPRAVQFAWEVGVGNSTGIGFGAII